MYFSAKVRLIKKGPVAYRWGGFGGQNRTPIQMFLRNFSWAVKSYASIQKKREKTHVCILQIHVSVGTKTGVKGLRAFSSKYLM